MGNTKHADADFTQRVLMSLIVDAMCLAENVDRMRAQIKALAKENGVHIPQED